MDGLAVSRDAACHLLASANIRDALMEPSLETEEGMRAETLITMADRR